MSSFTKMPIYSAHGNADEYTEVFLKNLADSPPEASYQPNTENNNQIILTEIIQQHQKCQSIQQNALAPWNISGPTYPTTPLHSFART